MKLKFVFFSLLCSCLILLSITVSSCQDLNSENIDNTKSDEQEVNSFLIITEFMCNNKTLFIDEENKYPDWIELENISKDTIYLGGYILTDKIKNIAKKDSLTGYIAPQERKVFFASGKKEGESQLNFKLDKSSGKIYLARVEGEVIQKIEYPKQIKNHSYLLYKNKWHYSNKPSPNAPNSEEGIIEGFALPVVVVFEKPEPVFRLY